MAIGGNGRVGGPGVRAPLGWDAAAVAAAEEIGGRGRKRWETGEMGMKEPAGRDVSLLYIYIYIYICVYMCSCLF
jgi:hypothetical protein